MRGKGVLEGGGERDKKGERGDRYEDDSIKGKWEGVREGEEGGWGGMVV